MPDYDNPETSQEQQYDPRFGEAYVNNVERVIRQGLMVRRTPNYNANNIGDTSALVLAGSLVIRAMISLFFRDGNKKKTKKNKGKSKGKSKQRTIKQVREEIKIEHNVQLPEPEYLTLPTIDESQIQHIQHVQPSTIVNYYYSTPTWGVYFPRDTERNSDYGYTQFEENDYTQIEEQPKLEEKQKLEEMEIVDEDIPDLISPEQEDPGTIIREYVKEDKENTQKEEEPKLEQHNICEIINEIQLNEEIRTAEERVVYLIKLICHTCENNIPDNMLGYMNTHEDIDDELVTQLIEGIIEIIDDPSIAQENKIIVITEILNNIFEELDQVEHTQHQNKRTHIKTSKNSVLSRNRIASMNTMQRIARRGR